MITVIGLGYVGLTTAVGLAFRGQRVFGYEIDDAKLAMIKDGHVPFHEPGMGRALSSTLRKKTFIPTNNLKEAVTHSQVVMFCVGTPSNDQGADLTILEAAIRDVLRYIDKYCVLVMRSTIPPGSTDGPVRRAIEDAGFDIGRDVGLAVVPEFLREGKAWWDVIAPDRIIIGTNDGKTRQRLKKIYGNVACPVHWVSPATAEFVKYLSNTLLATMISFANETATFAEAVGDVDVVQAFQVLHTDRRWSGKPAGMTSYVFPGAGFGGACLPKDTFAMIKKAAAMGQDMRLLQAVLGVNRSRQEVIVEKVLSLLKRKPHGAKVAVLGLAFKPGTSDVRETPSKYVIERLISEGVTVVAYDPKATEDFKRYGLGVRYCFSMREAVKGADAVVVMTAWPEFRSLPKICSMRKIVDSRYMFSGGL